MELLQLKYFRTAARLQNFTRAADYHSVPQSSISRTIARLEEELSCLLFTRSGKHVSLNEYGRVFLGKVDMALDSLNQGMHELATMADQRSESIRLAVREGSKLLPDVLSAFLELHPGARFSLVQHSEAAPDTEDFDLCIAALPLEDNELVCQELMTEEIRLAVPAGHVFARSEGVDLADTREERFIGLTASKSLRRVTDAFCRVRGFLPNVVFESDDAATVRGLIENGLGIAFVPVKSWKALTGERLRLLPVKGMDCHRTIAACWVRNRQMSPMAEKFRHFIVDWYASL